MPLECIYEVYCNTKYNPYLYPHKSGLTNE